jgi:hypothetical protein
MHRFGRSSDFLFTDSLRAGGNCTAESMGTGCRMSLKIWCFVDLSHSATGRGTLQTCESNSRLVYEPCDKFMILNPISSYLFSVILSRGSATVEIGIGI